MLTNTEAPQATIQPQPEVQATDAPESAQQSIDAILASVLNSVDEQGALKETAPEPAKEAPKVDAVAAKTDAKPDPPKDSVAKLMAAAVRRDREAGEKFHAAEKMSKEAQATVERYAKIESAMKEENYLAAIKMMAPGTDPNKFVLEAFAALDKDDKPLTRDELVASIRAEMEADFKQRQEAEKAEKQRLLDDAKKTVDQAFTGYVDECAQLMTTNADEYPILSSRGQFEKARADMLAFTEEMFSRHQKVPSHKDLLDQVEKELADSIVERVKTSKKYGWQNPGQARISSPTITPRMTSYEQGTGSTGPARERSIAEEMEAIQASIAQRFGA
jgi:hypothetical protein